jgi:hypothetical protein
MDVVLLGKYNNDLPLLVNVAGRTASSSDHFTNYEMVPGTQTQLECS